MKKILLLTMLLMLCAATAYTQSAAEQELLNFNSEYEKAQLNRDAAFFARVLADDYVFSNSEGLTEDKKQVLAWLNSEKEKPTYHQISLRSENVKARVSGNQGILTGDWVSTSRPIDDASAEPHIDRGRYTAILEKRGGNWVVIAEHASEAQHDRKLMEQEVLKASIAYTDVIRRRDKTGFERMLFDTYTYTNERGDIRNKAEDIAFSTAPGTTIESMVVSDRSVRVISNGSAVETGKFHIKGTNNGKAFDDTGRYTTTWIWRGGRWRIAADHTSNIPAK